MSVQRYDFVNGIGYSSDESRVESFDGDYILHSDYAALEARCAGMERERDAAKAFLHGAEVLAVDDLVSRGEDFVFRFGAHTAAITKRVIAERDALQAKLAAAEYALVEISNLPDCDSYMCRQIARDALADTTTGEVQP